ncbi:hypothetical protein [Mycolicibacterium aubagnense]|uniref:hypothetical protein n=1 Tax=Mycolicibacterium aubagnense TaxID=319707 RepID=UPI001F3F8D49|nr:hypothetical protein [Mycolicibacterium aubagnense]
MIPAALTNQRATAARTTPTTIATGTHTVRQRRVRHPTATITATSAVIVSNTGTQPCIKDSSLNRAAVTP